MRAGADHSSASSRGPRSTSRSRTAVGAAIDEIHRVSRRWIVALEYDHPNETEISYRGHAGALWKRDHGALWMTRHPELRLIRRIELATTDGYDNCTAHLFEKP